MLEFGQLLALIFSTFFFAKAKINPHVVIFHIIIINYSIKTIELMPHRAKPIKINAKIETEDDVSFQQTFFEQIPGTLTTDVNIKKEHYLQSQFKQPNQGGIFMKKENMINLENRFTHSSRDNMGEQSQKDEFQKTMHMLKTKQQKIMQRKNEKRNERMRVDRVNRICKNVIEKMRRTNICQQPILQESLIINEVQQRFRGIQLSEYFLFVYDFIGLIVLTCLMFFQSLIYAFPEINSSNILINYLFTANIYHAIEILVGFTTQKKFKGKKTLQLREIWKIYVRKEFLLDFSLMLVITILMITYDERVNEVLLCLLPFKIPKMMEKLQRIERRLFTNFYYERYISIVKIIFFNFAFAHFMAIFLNLMTEFNSNTNWQIVKNLDNADWFERYVWSYYWATTIMLTIGFGDFVPVNYQEAICLIFVEIFSCIAFSYNISCLGSIISAIRDQNQQREKSRKTYESIARKKGLSEKLSEKIDNFIDQSLELKTKFNIQEQKDLIQSLPAKYRKELICESNTSTLKGLTFFGELLNRTINNLSDKMEAHIYTPEEVVVNSNALQGIYILESGQISYFCNKENFNLNGIPINTVKRSQHSKPFLLNLDFLTMKRSAYSIKSTVYSFIQKLNFADFVQCMQTVPKDYEYYCYLRDQSKHKVDEYQTLDCYACKGRHTLFDCPKYHYMPLKETVVGKHLHQIKQMINQRKPKFSRSRFQSYKPLKHKIYRTQDPVFVITNQIKNIATVRGQRRHHKKLLSGLWNFSENIEINEQNWSDQMKLFKFIEHLLLNAKDNLAELNCYEDMWMIKLDKAHNYDLYFPQSNSSALNLTFSKNKEIACFPILKIMRNGSSSNSKTDQN